MDSVLKLLENHRNPLDNGGRPANSARYWSRMKPSEIILQSHRMTNGATRSHSAAEILANEIYEMTDSFDACSISKRRKWQVSPLFFPHVLRSSSFYRFYINVICLLQPCGSISNDWKSLLSRQPEAEMHLPSYLYIEYDLAKKLCLFFLNQLIRSFASNSRLLGKT